MRGQLAQGNPGKGTNEEGTLVPPVSCQSKWTSEQL